MPDSSTIPRRRFRPGGLNCRFARRFWLVGLAGQTRIASVGVVPRGRTLPLYAGCPRRDPGSLIERNAVAIDWLRLAASHLIHLSSIKLLPHSRRFSISRPNTYAIGWQLVTFMTGSMIHSHTAPTGTFPLRASTISVPCRNQ